MIFQMCKSTMQSKTYVEQNFTAEEVVEWFQFESYSSYTIRKQTEK